MVRVSRFERPISAFQVRRFGLAKLHPVEEHGGPRGDRTLVGGSTIRFPAIERWDHVGGPGGDRTHPICGLKGRCQHQPATGPIWLTREVSILRPPGYQPGAQSRYASRQWWVGVVTIHSPITGIGFTDRVPKPSALPSQTGAPARGRSEIGAIPKRYSTVELRGRGGKPGARSRRREAHSA